MSDATATVSRQDIYQRVTDQIIAQLEAGTVPWVQPWQAGATSRHVAALPHNASTGRAYSGINIVLLWCSAASNGYASHGWLTFKQAKAMGGTVRAGEHGTLVVYADRFVPKREAEAAKAEGREAAAIPFLKGYTVFNREQCDGLPAETVAEPVSVAASHAAADALIARTGARIIVGGDRAAYWIERDTITIPPMAAYEPHPINWYRTALHELGHWTGAAHRLARKFAASFGSADYAHEELAAEMTAAFTCAALGIVPTVRHADYIGSWLRVLRDDNRAIVRAASAASKAADYLLAFADDMAEAGVIPWYRRPRK